LLQCRPQSHLMETDARLPTQLREEEIIFATRRMAPQGRVSRVAYVVFVEPQGYYSLPTASARADVGRIIGRLNAALADRVFICIGPGRWGTNNPDLGVKIGYGDIYHTRALVELSGTGIGPHPEPSFGTHFFQDLVESNIYPLAIDLDDEDAIFREDFFYKAPNCLAEFFPESTDLPACLRVIDATAYRPGAHLELVMDDEQARSAAYLEAD